MTRIVNIAHGVVFMLGGLFTSALVATFPDFPGIVWLATFLFAPLGVVTIGLGIQQIVNTIRDRPDETFILHSLLITFSISLILIELSEIVFGAKVRLVSAPYPLDGSINLVGFQFSSFDVFIIMLTLLIIGGLWYLIEKTKYGMAIRASLFNPEMTSALGNNIKFLRVSIFALGSYLAGLGGSLYAISIIISPGTAESIILDSFIVTVIGGMGSFWGVLAGAVMLGITESYITALGLSSWLLVIPFVLVMVVLYISPQGLFGRAIE
jgi:branched-subunit amino acid ABC-type transport system permease component